MVAYPKEWKEEDLSHICKIYDGIHQTPKYTLQGVRFVSVENIKDLYGSKKFISKSAYENDFKVFPEQGDVLMTRIGDIGTSCVVDRDEPLAYYVSLALFKEIAINSWFLNYYIMSNAFQRELDERALHHATPQKINKGEIGKCKVRFPENKEEQRIVAETLTTFETYIYNLIKLIEKKRGIRNGALEDLMSGKTKIDGYETEWKTYSFENYFSTLSNNTFSRDMLSEYGEVGDIHYGDVLIKYGDVLTDADSIPRIKDTTLIKDKWYLKRNDVIIADTAEDDSVGKVVQIGSVSIPLVGGLHTVVCRPNYDTAEGFLGYYMNSKSYHDQLYPYITGIKVSSISKKSFGETLLTIPVDIDEQAAIVSVLTAMDEEIKSLEVERDKMIQIREGAMEDLLTGRVRLKA